MAKASLQFRNHEGVLCDAPKDLSRIVFTHYRELIVWSFNGKRTHRVRYGLSSKDFHNDMDAAHEVGECLRHWAESQGLLDI